jgi:hypothetical protein
MNITYNDGRESGPDTHPENLDQQLAPALELIVTPEIMKAYLSHRPPFN